MTADTPLAPKLRFPEFRDKPGWPCSLMGRYLSESRIKGSGGHEAKKLTVRLWGKGVFKKHESMQGSANTQYYRRRAGQLIYSKLDFLNQAFGIIPVHLDGFESTVDLPCFDIASEMNPKFLLECVQREQFYKTHGEIADGGRKAKRIQVDTFLECPIYTPSEPEQQKVADCLGSLDGLIAVQGRKLEALRQHKQGLMQQLFPQPGVTVPRLRFPEFRDAEEWEVRTLRSVCDLKMGDFVPAPIIAESHRKGLYPCYGGNGLRGYVASYTHDGRYVLIGRQGALCGNVLLCDGCFHATEHALVATSSTGVNVEWLLYALDVLRLNRFATGQAQPGLSVRVLNEVALSVPGDSVEQQRIADCLGSLDGLIAAQGRKLETLRQHKQGLMQQLFPSPERITS